MSRREAGNGVGARRKMLVPHLVMNRSKEIRDEDLVLFREMHKREKDVHVSLLQPISDEFEANGNNALYRVASGKRGTGLEFLAEDGKNDYDWLKTPPATPLFPSLEMEANAADLVVHREIPVIQPLSRFAGNSVTVKASTTTQRSKSPNPKPNKLPVIRHVTPSRKSTTSLPDKKNMKSAPVMNHLSSSTYHGIEKSPSAAASTTGKSIRPTNYNPASNLSKSILGMDSSTKPTSRGVSPLVRSKITAQYIPGFSAETPPNLKTDRSLSASRGRSSGDNQNPSAGQKEEYSGMKARRQSCSPSHVTRGRKILKETEGNTALQTGRVQQTSRAQIVGSRMVDKFLNARMSSSTAEERKIKTKLDGSMNESPGFGRVMSKNSLDMALKHMDFRRYSVNVHGHGPTNATNSSTTY